MQIVRGKRLAEFGSDELTDFVGMAGRVVVDVGTGDGRTAYRLAKANPDWRVIGLDPAWQRMSEISTKSSRKPAKGGTPNLLLVNAAVEAVPASLHGIADQLLVLMPWGKLLRGVVAGEADVCGGLRRLAKPGTMLDILIGASIWEEPVPLDIRDLPRLTPEYVDSELGSRLADSGWKVTDMTLGTSLDVDWMTSSWSRRLASSAPEPIARIQSLALDHL
ncbi:rRNA methyltransferase [Streptomyces nojiriensis]